MMLKNLLTQLKLLAPHRSSLARFACKEQNSLWAPVTAATFATGAVSYLIYKSDQPIPNKFSEKHNMLKDWIRQEKSYVSSEHVGAQDTVHSHNFRFDRLFKECSFSFDDSIENVVIVDPYHDLTQPIPTSQIPSLELDQVAQDVTEKYMKENKITLNDPQLFLKYINYDKPSKTLFIGFVQSDYVTMCCLRANKFPVNHPIYKLSLSQTGVLVLMITKDQKIHLLERRHEKQNYGLSKGLFSFCGGFMDCLGPLKKNIIVDNALKELIEELLGTPECEVRDDIHIKDIKLLGTVSLCYPDIGYKYSWHNVRFFTVVLVNLTAEELETQFLRKNISPDAPKEHEGTFNPDGSFCISYQRVDLNPEDFSEIQRQCSHCPGSFLWGPGLKNAHHFVHGNPDRDQQHNDYEIDHHWITSSLT